MKLQTLIAIGIVTLLAACQPAALVVSPAPITTPDPVIFADDFSDPSSGWPDIQRADRTLTYVGDRYRMVLNRTNMDIWATPGRTARDVVLQVEASKAGGPDQNDFGLICRYQNDQNFYFFVIGSDGFYGVGKMVDGVQQLIGMDRMDFSRKILPGAATNQIEAECIGDTLRLAVNGTILATERDSSFGAGEFGLIVGTFGAPGADITFDNFSALRP